MATVGVSSLGRVRLPVILVLALLAAGCASRTLRERIELLQISSFRRVDQEWRRIARVAAPELIEGARYVPHHGADSEHIEVDVAKPLASLEVFIGDVAATDDGRDSIDGQRLVMHPAVQPREVGEVVE